MKFGEQLRSSIISKYRFFYLNYDALKEQLKAGIRGPKPHDDANGNGEASGSSRGGQGRRWSGADEEKFLQTMNEELEKVWKLTRVESETIQRLIAVEEGQVKELVRRMQECGPNESGPSEEEFIFHESKLEEIIAAVYDLGTFIQINYTGFHKIVKKHDKMTSWALKPNWDVSIQARPFFKENLDRDLVKLSDLFNLVRTRGNPATGDSSAGGKETSFVRNTTKYWVHPDNIMELKSLILKHLPVLVFNKEKEFTLDSSAISSIYYDNPEKWDLYEGRLKKTEGAEAIRLRWYGEMDSDNIFVERKTHREDWTGEKSVKERFVMKEKHINGYMRGDILPIAIFEKARKEGKKPIKKIDEEQQLAQEVQYSVLKKGYKPVCRSFYHRIAYQLPGDARVRISLDTELTMTREDNLDGERRAGDNWRRMDIGIDWPFKQLPAGDVCHFPYAVLEVKLQTQHGQEPPEWIRQVISSHLVEAVPKFSKFIHGTASMFPSHIHLLPYWMPQMDVDIRKPVTHDFGIRRLEQSSGSVSEDDDSEDEDDENDDGDQDKLAGRPRDSNNSSRSSTTAIRKIQELDGNDIENQMAGSAVPDPDYPIYESDDDEEGGSEDELAETRRVGGWHYYSALTRRYAHKTGQSLVKAVKILTPRPRASTVPHGNRHRMFFGDQEVRTRRFKAPPGKKIYVPVRVEPKVYFAAERTFLGWLEFSIYIGAVAVILLNFGAKPSRTSFIVAGFFTCLALLALAYSVGIYIYRSRAIRQRRAIKYYDRWGPSALCAALFAGIMLNFLFEGRDREMW